MEIELYRTKCTSPYCDEAVCLPDIDCLQGSCPVVAAPCRPTE